MIKNTLEHIWEIIEDVKNSSGKMKISVLEEAKSEELERILWWTYNPYKNFYIKKLPRIKEGNKALSLIQVEELLTKLSDRVVTGNEAKELIEKTLSNCTTQILSLVYRVINKDLKCGISTTTINKVWNNLIPTFDVMLAEKLSITEHKELLKRYKPDEEIYIEPKLDGIRIVAFIKEDRVELYSRKGVQVNGYNELEKLLSETFTPGMVIDGELMSPEFEFRTKELMILLAQGKHKQEEKLRMDDSIWQDLIKSAFKKTDNKLSNYYIFDVMTEDEFLSGKTKTLDVRKKRISAFILSNHTTLKIVPYEKANSSSWDRVKEAYNYYYSIGYEGIMIKRVKAQYQKKRSWDLIKLKPHDTIDLEIIDIKEGEKGSKYEGTMGSAVVSYKNNTVDIGTGWKDEEREYYWNHPSELIGKVLEISYQRESKNQDGQYSLIFPSKKGVRNDR